jgi:hypothetical protein
MKNLSRHTDHLCELVTSLLIRGILLGEMSEMGWLIGLDKHAIWADSLYFLYLRAETDLVSETLCFLVFRVPDDG